MIDRLDIHAFADRELTPEEMARLEKEIASSPDASRELGAIQGLKNCLQTKAVPADHGRLWKECVGRLDELDKVKRAEHFVGKYAWALCSLLAVVILSGSLFNRFHAGAVDMPQIASDLSGMTSVPMQGLSQPERLRSWIGSGPRIDSSKVVGVGSMESAEGVVIKRVTLREQNGLIDVYLIPNVSSVNGVQPIEDGMFAGRVNGRNCVIRPDSGFVVLVAGDRPIDELHNIAAEMYR